MIATITSKGQLTLPKKIRDELKINAGDKIEFFIRHDGHIECVPLKSPVTKLKGILPKLSKTVTIDEMNQAVAEGSTDYDCN